MAGTLSPVGKQYFVDDNGNPLASGKLYTYQSGSSTPAPTYNSATLTTGNQNANPIILNARGECTIYLDALSYKYILKTAADVEIWSADPVQSVAANLPSGIGEIFEFGGSPDSQITATSYSAGATYAACHAGTAWCSLDTIDLVAGIYELEAMLLATAGTVTAAIVNLTDGSPDTPIGTCASSSTTGELQRSGSLTLAAGGAPKTYAIKTKTSGGAVSFAWGLKLVRTA